MGEETFDISRLPIEKLQALALLAESAGVDLLAEAKVAPEFYTGQPASTIARELGRMCAERDIFEMGGRFATIDDSGQSRAMTSDRFVTWIEDFVTPYSYDRSGTKKVQKSISKDLAGKVLSSDVFRSHVKQVDFINPVRMPALRESCAELLPAGYDAKTRSFTVDSLDYDKERPLDVALSWLEELYHDFPFAEKDGGGISSTRSGSVQVGAMLSMFCRLFFKGGRPLVLYLANQRGSGKSLLALMALSPVFGNCFSDDLPKKEELKKALDAKALEMAPYIWYDDIEKWFFSTTLNRFVVAPGHSGRILGTPDSFRVPNVTQVFATGNFVVTSEDLQRRTVFVELFEPREIQGREFGRVITEQWVQGDDFRAEALASLWAIVKHWDKQGRPPGPRSLATFAHWASCIGGMLHSVGWADPLEPPALETGGDEQGADFIELFTRLGSELAERTIEEASEERAPWEGAECTYTRAELVGYARSWGLLEHLVGAEGDPELKTGEVKKFGQRLAEYRGREISFEIRAGREQGAPLIVEFGRRRGAKGAITYPCRVFPAS